jgi:hypothetical protein
VASIGIAWDDEAALEGLLAPHFPAPVPEPLPA